MKRNRQLTEKRIVDAAIDLLAEVGFEGFGVNAVAARAGVDKVLIYRYFSGLDGLLEHIGASEVLFPKATSLLDSDLTGFYRNYTGALSANPLSASLHNWERVASNPLTAAFRQQRDQFWQEAVTLLRPQSDAARSVISLLAEAPLNGDPAHTLAPLLATTECDPVQAPPPAQGNPAERLADNLL